MEIGQVSTRYLNLSKKQLGIKRGPSDLGAQGLSGSHPGVIWCHIAAIWGSSMVTEAHLELYRGHLQVIQGHMYG